MTRARLAAVLLVVVLPAGAGCAYFNTLYNARAKYREAQDIKRREDPDREKISSQEEKLYTEAIAKAARVVKYYPDSKWVDDALLLMGMASFEKGDYSTALRKFDEILTFFPESNLTARALLTKGRTLIETKEYDAAVETLSRAAEVGGDDLRDDVAYFLGLVQHRRRNDDEALVAFTDVVSRDGKGDWFAAAGLLAGEISMERGDYGNAVAFFEKVRSRGRTPEERFRGGVRKGEALLELGEHERARTTFHDVAKRSVREEDKGKVLLKEAGAIHALGDVEGAILAYEKILDRFSRRAAAAEAQLAIARIYDEAGDLEKAREQYDLVREQGTGHAAWREASARQTEIQRVLDLREAIASEQEPDRDRKRFLLAEQLLEKIGDVDAALAEYVSLAEDAFGTEWGARALFAEAWVLENRLQRPEAADSLLFRLANYYSGTEVDAHARKKLGYPVWTVEEIQAPPVHFIRPEAREEPEDIVVSRIDPRDVPLPEGVEQVKVWVRVRIGDDGTAEAVKVVKSGGDAFDEAALEAARASTFLAPGAGGAEITVLEFVFPPSRKPVVDDEPSAAERDAMLDAHDAATPVLSSPLVPPVPADSAAADSAASALPNVPPRPDPVRIRDRLLDAGGDD